MVNKEEDLYIIVKSIMAKNVKDAIKKEKESNIVNIYMDDEWKKNKISKSDHVGFK